MRLTFHYFFIERFVTICRAAEVAVEAAASCDDVCASTAEEAAVRPNPAAAVRSPAEAVEVAAARNKVRYRRCRLNLSWQYLLPARRSSAQNSARRKSPERSSLSSFFSSCSLPLPEDSSQFPYQEDNQQAANYLLGDVKGYSDQCQYQRHFNPLLDSLSSSCCDNSTNFALACH